METFDKILKLLQEQGKDQKELADYIGVGQSKITDWKAGRLKSYTKYIGKIAEFFNVSPSYFYNSKIKSTSQKREVLRIPVFGKVAAGVPMTAVEDIIDYEEVWKDEYSDGEYMALQIRGSSMEPKFSEGDVVIVKLQPDVDSGQIAVMIINGDEATVKRLVKHKEGIALVSTNPTYEPMYFSNKEIRELPVTVFGRVVELRAKF